LTALLYGLAIIVLYWTPVGLLLHGYYVHKYQDSLEEAEFHLDQDMKTWSPAVGAALVLIVPEDTLMVIAAVGMCFEAYMTYTEDQGSLGKFKRFLKGDKDE
jgi:hypothetical protein